MTDRLPPRTHENRRGQISDLVRTSGLDALLVTAELNVRYLTGFTGDSTYLYLPAAGRSVLISDRRYETQIAEECPGLDAVIRPPGQSLPLAAAAMLQSQGQIAVGLEAGNVTLSLHETLTSQTRAATYVPTEDLVETQRAIKDDGELAEIRLALRQAIRGFQSLRAVMTPDLTELHCARELELLMRRFGARGIAFETIIGTGDRAAMPHYHAGMRRLEESPLVLIDWGAETHSLYRCDLTRTLLTGPATPEMQRVYETVAEAQRRAIAEIRPGATGSAIHACAAGVIEQAGYGELGHGLGHGFGLQIHERPRLGPNFDHVLQPGMVVTVEPGIYIRGEFGVRIEDDILVTPDGCEVLSAALPSRWDFAQAAW